MRQARIDRWRRGTSVLHRRHAAAKIIVTLALLISIATLPRSAGAYAVSLGILFATCAVARIPPLTALATSAVVLPFALCFAAVTLAAGDSGRAVGLIARSWLSSFGVTLLIATTPLPSLIDGLEFLRAPRFLLLVMQFLYRYTAVLSSEAKAMREAGLARGGTLRAFRFRHAAAAAGALFARSHARAQAIHRAMLARGFDGTLPVFERPVFQGSDAMFAAAGIALIFALPLALHLISR